MAQKREKEETEKLKLPEFLTSSSCTTPIPPPPKLPATDDLISTTTPRSPDNSDPPPDLTICTPPKADPSPDRSDRNMRASDKAVVRRRLEVNRCAGCRRRVGLTGFRCRCGELFCPVHRYSDRHECSFDYKAAGREAIARENPVVRPAKILKV
ncbi:zinc finger A20 and AN1 domain-containing stress-associated protein 1-like [Cornus florida]|uniref:zinc finger A20 and AN1 domain-containing stress-associated protein 1-like n=1 Tax=Cornus florida TaxID=4283 RepID=UPI00289CCEE7|nr:zinc finger A20 and AN1 domain-containing stress-associated protein 1-like [Cornus florida]